MVIQSWTVSSFIEPRGVEYNGATGIFRVFKDSQNSIWTGRGWRHHQSDRWTIRGRDSHLAQQEGLSSRIIQPLPAALFRCFPVVSTLTPRSTSAPAGRGGCALRSAENMKILCALILLTAIGVVACGDPKSRSFFASGGISVGAPVAMNAGHYRIPIEFETEIVHSGQWIDTVEAEVDGTKILVTAVFTHANRESRYPGYVEISDVSPGAYILHYQDPGGARHLIESIILP